MVGWGLRRRRAGTGYGVSAGLATIAGALGVVVWRRWGPVAGTLLLVGVFGFFASRLLVTGALSHYLSESEHVIAAGVGIVLELRSR
jgi:hypothetical protein